MCARYTIPLVSKQCHMSNIGAFIGATALLCIAPLPTIIFGVGFESWQFYKQAGRGTYCTAARRVFVCVALFFITMSYLLPINVNYKLQSAATTAFFVGLTVLCIGAQSAPDAFRPAMELQAVFAWKPSEKSSSIKETAGRQVWSVRCMHWAQW